MLRRSLGSVLCLGLILFGVPVMAQTSPDTTSPDAAPAASSSDETRPALPTFFGDTGIWFLPTADTLAQGKWSGSLFRINFDRQQGFTDISHIGLTGAFGVTDRLEVFTSWRAITRIDRDLQPLFIPGDTSYGGVDGDYPYVRDSWTKNLRGDLIVGGKYNLVSESRGEPMGLAFRLMAKLPTGIRRNGASTGDWDAHADIVASREAAEAVELTGQFGGVLRGDPDGFDLSDSIRWGMGAAFPSRSPLRALVEWHGEWFFDPFVQTLQPLRASDGSFAPDFSKRRDIAGLKLGAVWQSQRGAFIGAGLNYSQDVGKQTIGGRSFESKPWGLDVRLGWHGGVKKYVPPPAGPTPEELAAAAAAEAARRAAAAPPPPAPNRNPVFSGAITCDPCTVETGKQVRLGAQATDPDGDTVTYRWSAPAGTFANPNGPTTTWTAPNQEGSVPVTVTAEDGKGGAASNMVTVQVTKPRVIELHFDPVHFDFDKYNLKPEALKILDDAVQKLSANGQVRITIEGHTDSVGTAEYNIGLGERRARSVYDYLANRGVARDRMETRSFGEERPVASNTTSAGRAQNRRAVLTVRIQQE